MRRSYFNYHNVGGKPLSREELEKLTLKELSKYVLAVVGRIYGMRAVNEKTREAFIEALVTENLNLVYRKPKPGELY